MDPVLMNSALNSFNQDDQQQIILFIHDKLPLQASKAHPHHSSKLCLSCQRELEDSQHLLACCHLDQSKLSNALKDEMTKKTQKFQLHPSVFTMIWLVLVSVHTDTPYEDMIAEVAASLRQPIKLQVPWSAMAQSCVDMPWSAMWYGMELSYMVIFQRYYFLTSYIRIFIVVYNSLVHSKFWHTVFLFYKQCLFVNKTIGISLQWNSCYCGCKIKGILLVFVYPYSYFYTSLRMLLALAAIIKLLL